MGPACEILREERRDAEAEKLQRDVLKIQRRAPGPERRGLADSIYKLGCLVFPAFRYPS